MVEPHGVLYKEEVNGMETLIAALRSWAVEPGGDADREGSVAHVMRECVSDLERYGIHDLEGLLNKLQVELVKLRQNGGEKKPITYSNGAAIDGGGSNH